MSATFAENFWEKLFDALSSRGGARTQTIRDDKKHPEKVGSEKRGVRDK
jgi:hypothetical protein